ncbi:sulfurtransferase complex subunit TusC [Pseudomonas sp. RTC3]|uniref:sulfurtransferase complex subunit TusC n=1 Tax=unclassified Pseudomonas TaxID=196821 RepID=UPI002AB53F55|nr:MULTISPECIES: sulfurtransferase complex subunit TusC [unclassified Pseudomonas]MEB0064731.1 sulfurtransferase complex subunit TusC [Pseudomonas sp. RTC3]MDY7565497.1 sulfurtransferase complex subunit TusC [Pseudomonas sp. 5C2]MEB0008823.1 sulfurtransferase complex subunit TusC [Pseudomonas sp. RTB2]MEB0019238.1 sulfurtransferase complex subunit TusC [Pseudomonas sp. RTB3]MEB0027747.1 sulfurtransferase complex subunit TusC [Pseudomonas sp. MH9.2]
MPASLLIISRQAPWSGPGAREALDIVLAGGAFDLPIGLLFLDDGVLQLLPEQQAAQVQQKDLTANLKALSLFGVEDIFACNDSLVERGIPPKELNLDTLQLLQASEISAIIDRYDQVITL